MFSVYQTIKIDQIHESNIESIHEFLNMDGEEYDNLMIELFNGDDPMTNGQLVGHHGSFKNKEDAMEAGEWCLSRMLMDKLNRR